MSRSFIYSCIKTSSFQNDWINQRWWRSSDSRAGSLSYASVTSATSRLTSSFAAVIVTTTTRGRRLTANMIWVITSPADNDQLIYWYQISFYLLHLPVFSYFWIWSNWLLFRCFQALDRHFSLVKVTTWNPDSVILPQNGSVQITVHPRGFINVTMKKRAEQSGTNYCDNRDKVLRVGFFNRWDRKANKTWRIQIIKESWEASDSRD